MTYMTNGRGLPKERTWHFHSRINTFCGLKRQPHTNTILGRVQSEQAPQTSESTQQPSGRPYSQEDLNDYHHVIDTEETLLTQPFLNLSTLSINCVSWSSSGALADYFQGLEEGRHPVKPNIKGVHFTCMLTLMLFALSCMWLCSSMFYNHHLPNPCSYAQPGFLNGQLPNAPPENPEPWADIFEDFKSKLMPVCKWQIIRSQAYSPQVDVHCLCQTCTCSSFLIWRREKPASLPFPLLSLRTGVLHWQAPSFFGYFPANSSYPGMLADWLASASNMIGFSW
eukprot:1159275-Pelagomonas_calceolata.AAC.1